MNGATCALSQSFSSLLIGFAQHKFALFCLLPMAACVHACMQTVTRSEHASLLAVNTKCAILRILEHPQVLQIRRWCRGLSALKVVFGSTPLVVAKAKPRLIDRFDLDRGVRGPLHVKASSYSWKLLAGACYRNCGR